MNLYNHSVTAGAGTQEVPLKQYEGDVVLVVNTASECGFTPQLKGLEELHEEFGSRGLTVLGFPCNQFGGQEPGSDEEIVEFCRLNYGVTFPVLDKVDVNGKDADPLFEWLKSEKPGLMGLGRLRWNFTKFLIGRDGEPIRRYSSQVEPKNLRDDIEQALAA